MTERERAEIRAAAHAIRTTAFLSDNNRRRLDLLERKALLAIGGVK